MHIDIGFREWVIFHTGFNGHGFLLKDYMMDYTKLQEGPLCPLLRVPE